MKITVPNYRQGDYPHQRLGTVDGITIASDGCAITCVSMVDSKFDPSNPWTPDQVDNWFTDRGGYVDGSGHRSPHAGCALVDWSAINRLLPNSLWQGADRTPNTRAPIDKIRDHLDSGGLVILEVRFGGNPSAMHFVVGVGYNGDDIIYNDPFVGDTASFANGRFGSGLAYADIMATHYFIDTAPDVPSPPPVAPVSTPIQPAPAPAPETPPAPSPEPPENQATPPPVPVPESAKPDTPAEPPLQDPIRPLPTVPSTNEMRFIMETFLEYLSGKKTYIVAVVTILYGLLTGHLDAVLQGLGLAGLRAGVTKSQ